MIVLLLLLGLVFLPSGWRDRLLGGGSSHIHAIAVLPFVNVGADPNIEYLADGITEGIISSLSRVPELAGDGPQHGVQLQRPRNQCSEELAKNSTLTLC